MKIKIKLLREGAAVPQYATEGSAGADLCALLDSPVTVAPGETVKIPTGISIELPVGLAAFVYARSGSATKRGLAPANKVGVIDSDYRGEIFVAIHNHSKDTATVEPGERIAQLVIAPVIHADFDPSDELCETARGDGGFGSTGTK